MDKFEYKVRAEEIKSLIAQGDYAQAAEIADTIDWRRVKSVMMLCTISDLYKINRRYEDARNMLLMAYDRHPGGRTICYSLCELSIKMGDFVEAVEYYKEFVQIAPKDTGRYILQYKLYEAQDVSLEERIAVLEELKKRDYREKWAYELAYLYHRVGLSTRCVEECDELILWFGDGKYVIKALELKMLHQPLTPEQQQKYEYRFEPRYEQAVQDNALSGRDPQEEPEENGGRLSDEEDETYLGEEPSQEEASQEDPSLDIHVRTVDVSQYNTLNLQRELAEGLKEVLGEDENAIAAPVSAKTKRMPAYDKDTESFDTFQMEEVEDETIESELPEGEVFFGETGELDGVEDIAPEDVEDAAPEDAEDMENIAPEDMEGAARREDAFAEALSMEPDGQISLVMPDVREEEKQITGQLSIEDITQEWERLKREANGAEEEYEEAPEYGAEEEYEETPEDTAEEEYEETPEDGAEEEYKEAPEDAPDISTENEKNQEAHIRSLSKEEKELFGPFIQNRLARHRLTAALDKISMAAYTGNVIVTGDEGTDTLNLAKNIIRDVQLTDHNFSGRTAKISGESLNQKDVVAILDQLKNGALIIQKASGIDGKTAASMYRKLQQESLGIVVVMEDTRKKMNRFLEENRQLEECFNARVDLEALSNEALVAFGKKYAREMEHSIDELGVLALHTRIEEMQSIDHAVTVMEVKGLIDDAIRHAGRKNIKHFMDVLMAKRYDEEDMIILREKDFM